MQTTELYAAGCKQVSLMTRPHNTIKIAIVTLKLKSRTTKVPVEQYANLLETEMRCEKRVVKPRDLHGKPFY